MKPGTKPLIRLEAYEGYRHAESKLHELKKQIGPHEVEKNRFELQLNRASNAVRQFASRDAPPLPFLSDGELDSVVRKIISAGLVESKLLAELRSRVPKMQIVDDEHDLGILLRRDDERATIDLLKHAIQAQEKEVRAQKQSAVVHICESLKASRQPVIGRLAEALIKLGQTIAEEKDFEEYLAKVEPDLATAIKPQIFPNLLVNADVFAWFGECINANLLTDEQIRALEELIPFQKQAAVSA